MYLKEGAAALVARQVTGNEATTRKLALKKRSGNYTNTKCPYKCENQEL